AWDPGPVVVASRANAASTSRMFSDGSAAAGGRSGSEAHPTPIDPRGSSPERYATATATSPGPTARSVWATRSVFASRDDVDATPADARASWRSSTERFSPTGRAPRSGRVLRPGYGL